MNDIFLFNPTGEMAIANGMVSYIPPKKLRIFEDDLCFLPSFYAQKGDTVITSQIPDETFLKKWQSLGLPELNYHQLSNIKEKKAYNHIKPWSWNQAIHQKVNNIKQHTSEAFRQSPNYNWKPEYKSFYSRQTTNDIQEYISKKSTIDSVSIETPAISIHSLADFNEWMKMQSAVILKMPWSSSGRGIHMIDMDKNLPVNYVWIKSALKQQGYFTAEPLLNKKFDFSFQFHLKLNGEIDLLGISYSINDKKGHFIGGHVKWPHKSDSISSFLQPKLIHKTANLLIEAIKSVKPQNFYEGIFGVDAIVYKNINKELMIHPCVDINWRYTMGTVNISLDKYLHHNSIGIWTIGSFKPNGWNLFIHKKEREQPLVTSDSKIVSGFIQMTPCYENAHFGVWMEAWGK